MGAENVTQTRPLPVHPAAATNRNQPKTLGRKIRAFGFVALIGVFGSSSLRACNPTPAPAKPAPATIGAPLPIADELLTLVNQQRAANGLAPLRLNGLLNWAAEGHSKEQAQRKTMTHTGANGSNPGKRIAFTGYKARTWGENVAVGYTTSAAVMEGWMNSPGHRANILNGSFTEIGLSAVPDSNGRIYWTMDLAAQ